MSETTGISWCDSTVNFWEGCTKVSPACDHCYAERKNKWLRRGQNWGPGAPRQLYSTAPATVRSWQRNAPKFRAAHGRDRRVFVNSTSDWLDNEVPIEWLITLLDTMRNSPDVTFLLLSKRIGNWRKRLEEAWTACHGPGLSTWLGAWLDGAAPANVWVMATVVTQEEADRDVVKLLAVPARVRGLSIEPMLGPIDLTDIVVRHGAGTEDHFSALYDPDDDEAETVPYVDWVIAGGESGPHARPADGDWYRSLRDQCAAAGVPFHFKQHGEWIDVRDLRRLPGGGGPGFGIFDHCKHDVAATGAVRIGKAAGRLLDGVEHNDFPA